MIVKHAARKPGTRDRLLGLIEYLAGPGRFEEHTNPHVVAGWHEGITEMDLGNSVDRADIAGRMEWPADVHQMETPKDGWVYHVPISLHPDDPRLSDEQWSYVARKVADKLGFGGDGGCRWIAVHHGLAHSEEGPRDHIHLVVHRAREDGTIASTWNDRYKMAEIRAELEDDPTLGLRVKTQRRVGGREGWRQGELAKAQRAGRDETDRERLERLVRAAAGAAESEADWVLSLRRQGVLIRPRYAQGGQQEVVGYSVAVRPAEDQAAIWYGGGRLSKDLTLPAIRRRWDGHNPADALSAWSSSAAGEGQTLPADVWPQAHDALHQFAQDLAATPLHDHVRWRAAARETAEALAALAGRATGEDRRTLRLAAIRMARSAELPSAPWRGQPSNGARSMLATCRVISSALIAHQGGMVAVLQLVLQLAQITQAVRRAHEAAGAAAAARHSAMAEAELLGLHQRMLQEHTTAGPQRPRTAAQLAALTAGDDRARGTERTRPATPPRTPARPQSRPRGNDGIER